MPKNSHGERRQRLRGGCREKVRQRWAEARCWGTSVPQNKPIASLHLEGVSGSRRMAMRHSDWLSPLSSAGNPPLLHRPASQTPTLLQQRTHVLWCPFSPEVFPGRQVAALLLTSPLLLASLPTHLISPADSINQLDAGAAESQAIMETDQVPWNSLSQRGLGGLQADSGVERAAELCGQMLPTWAGRENQLESCEKHTPFLKYRCPGRFHCFGLGPGHQDFFKVPT